MKFPAFTHPHDIPAMQKMLDGYIKHQENFDEILRYYLSNQEMAYPVFGWFYINRTILSDWLKST